MTLWCNHTGLHTQKSSVLDLLFCLPCIEFLKCFSTGTASFYFALSHANSVAVLALSLLYSIINGPCIIHCCFLFELNWQHPHWSSCLKFCLPLVYFQHNNQSDRVCVCIVCQIISFCCLNSSHDCDNILPCSAIMKQSSMIWSPLTVDLICHSSPLSCPVQWEHFTLGLCFAASESLKASPYLSQWLSLFIFIKT